MPNVSDYFAAATYPMEQTYSGTNLAAIDNIRAYIGDHKGIDRKYVDSCYRDVMGDSYTYVLPLKGWPLKVVLTNASGTYEYTTKSNPVVYDHRYLLFSGAQNTITTTATFNIWYETFAWSDKEIYTMYVSTGTVPGMKYGNETEEMVQLFCAITILKSEFQKFAREGAVRIEDGDTVYNPSTAIDARNSVLENLEKRLDDLIKSYGMKNVTGVRVE